ncbi:MAG: S41 family peptidase [Myxococcales bacterium]|nr:S41 family peptidase [Myxococcales bacterium]
MSRSPKWLTILLVAALVVSTFTAVQAVKPFASEAAESIKIFTDALAIIHTKYVEEISLTDLVYNALDGMLVKLDPHSAFMRPDEMREMSIDTRGKFEGLGIEITIRDNFISVISPIDGSPAAEAGLQPGDFIVKIESESTRGMSLLDAVKRLRGAAGTKVKIQVWRKGWTDPHEYELTRAKIVVKTIREKNLEPGYGYVKVSQFNENTDVGLRQAIESLQKQGGNLKGLVLDLRNNPGGLLDQAVKVSDLFVDEGLIVYTKGRGDGPEFNALASKVGTFAEFPIVVLINAGSASASEIVAGCLQDHHRAIIVGERSFGKGSVQTIIPLSDGSGMRLTTAKYFTPNGRDIQAKGIEPDLFVPGDPYAGMDENRRKMLREADLDRHLKGADDEKSPDDAVDVPPISPEDGKPAGAEGPEDPQLDTALRVLKAWPAFQKAATATAN